MKQFRAVLIAALCVAICVAAGSQVAKRRGVSKGPRALALVEVATNGHARLEPVTIMVDGKFYDASVYKANPVPMALQPETVYEGFKAGVSQGLFTVSTGIQTTSWFGLGIWKSNEQIAADKAKREARIAKLTQKPAEDATAGGPPRLSRSRDNPPPKTTAPPHTSPAETDDRPKLSNNNSSSAHDRSLAEAEADRPVLRRQEPGQTGEQTKAGLDDEPLKGPLQTIPAISDAGGPQAHPYTYEMKPEEQEAFLTKMKAMAADELARKQASAGSEGSKNGRKPLAPEWKNFQLHVFDVSSSNEAVLVFTADANLGGRSDVLYSIALAARQDIYGDLHRIFVTSTDDKHLDVQPKYDFIDVVDADGDGRGELLFRQTWDVGKGYAVYRVIGDRLWPLYESKPSS